MLDVGCWMFDLACSLRRQQLDQSSIFFRPANKIQRAEIMLPLGCAQAFILDNFGQQRRCLFAARTPDDAPSRRSISLRASFGQPRVEETVPLPVGSDPESFQVPAILPVMLHGELS